MTRIDEGDKQLEAQAVAYLLSQGYTQDEIGRMMRIGAPRVTRRKKLAGENHWLEKRPPRFARERLSSPRLEEIEMYCYPQLRKLRERLNRIADKKNVACIRHIRAFFSGSTNTTETDWDLRLEKFGRAAGSYVSQLIPNMNVVGITWGRTLACLAAGIRDHSLHPRPAENPVRFVSLCGESLDEPMTDLSSSTLAMKFNDIVNGARGHPVYLGPVPAFVPARFTPDEANVIRKFIGELTGYDKVFGDADPLANRLDCLITTIGYVSEETQGRLLDDRLKAEGIDKTRLSQLVIGDVGGVLIPQPDLLPEDRKLVDEMNSRWTGVQRKHLEQCAQAAERVSAKATGVLALAVGKAKAAVVIEAIGLISHLLIDDELAEELDSIL